MESWRKSRKSADKANAKRIRDNAQRNVLWTLLWSSSQSSTPSNGLEANEIYVANHSDRNITLAPPNISLLQNESTLNNETLVPLKMSLLQNEGTLNNDTPDPHSILVLQHEGTSHSPHIPEAQTKISNDLASEFASKSDPPTLSKFWKL